MPQREPRAGRRPRAGRPREFLYIVDTENQRIRRVDFAADVHRGQSPATDKAGFSRRRRPRDGGVARPGPRDVALGPDGRLYIADTDNHRVRAVNLATGVITTVVGDGVDAFRRRRRRARRPRSLQAALGDHVRRRRQPLHRRHEEQPRPDGDAVNEAERAGAHV